MTVRRARRALALAADWPIAMEAVLLTLLVRASLRHATIGGAAAVLRRWRRLPRAIAVVPDRAACIVQFVSGRLARQECLTQSFVLAALLQRRGWPAVVCIGARRDEDRLAAHAWIRCGDRLLLHTGGDAFVPLCTVGSEVDG